jgi:hypothetical protein
VLSSVLALFSLFIQVVDEHGERSQELRQAKEKGSGKPTAIVNGMSLTEARANDTEKASGETRGMGTVSLHL